MVGRPGARDAIGETGAGLHVVDVEHALLAAVLTPPDLISQVLLMAPLMLLYGASIAAAYAARYRMNRLDRDAE